jgi:hypothetical protein
LSQRFQTNIAANERITSTLATAPLLPQYTLSADPVFPAAGELPAGGLGAVFEGADPDPVPVLVVPVDVDPLKGIVTGSTGFPMRPHVLAVPATDTVNP